MKQGLSLRLSQNLALTPQLQQSIRLLQLSTLELEQEIGQMLDDNPFLEPDPAEEPFEASPAAPPEAALAAHVELDAPASHDAGAGAPDDLPALDAAFEAAWTGAATDSGGGGPEAEHHDAGDFAESSDPGDWGEPGAARSGAAPEDDNGAGPDWARAPESLTQHLHQQACALRLEPQVALALHALIESLDDDGYLADGLDELAAALCGMEQTSGAHAPDSGLHTMAPLSASQPMATDRRHAHWQHCLQQALEQLQQMEPTGVGARNLAECLQLQILELRNRPESRTALAICQQPLDYLARRDSRRLAQLCRCNEALVRAAFGLIARLEPKPGRRFAVLEPHQLRPDVIVTAQGRGFKVALNPEVLPRLRLHDTYALALRQGRGGGQSHAGLQQHLQEARWFIKNIQQRFDTILRVASAIVERQRPFFQHGALAMRPLVLREIADEVGLHESTISRVTSAKFMATPQGTYEFKYFFGSALATEAGSSASSTAVRALIQQLIAAENPGHPLSDNQLADLLKAQGIACARRTVAKYREALRIAPTHLRKAL
jgi:RNA polymerase sigma-54 factor